MQTTPSAQLRCVVSIFIIIYVIVRPVCGGMAARNVSIPIFSQRSSKVVAILHAKEVATQARKVGFFKVRLLSQVVITDAELELTAGGASDALNTLQDALRTAAKNQQWEIQRFRLTKNSCVILQADTVHPTSAELSETFSIENVIVRSNGTQIVLPRAELSSGKNSLLVACIDNGKKIIYPVEHTASLSQPTQTK